MEKKQKKELLIKKYEDIEEEIVENPIDNIEIEEDIAFRLEVQEFMRMQAKGVL
jgi:hypothetical protein